MKRRLGIDYDHLFHILPECYLVVANDAPTFTVIDASDALLEMGNFTRENFLEKPLIEVYPTAPGKDNKDGSDKLLESFARCIETGQPHELGVIRYDVKSADTDSYIIRYWKTVNYPIFKDSVVSGVLLTTHDATEEILAEERLRGVAEQNAYDIPAGVIGSWRYVVENGTVIADKATAHIFGISEAKAIKGLPLNEFIDFIHQDDKERVVAHITQSSRENTAYESEYQIIAANEELKWVIARGQMNSDGTELVGILIDITDRKNESLEIRDNEKRLRFMADTMPQMIWTAQPDGHHDYFNKRWYDYTGETIGQSDGEAWKRVVHPDDVERASALWAQSCKTGEDYDIEYRIKDKSTGEYKWFTGKATAYKNKQGKIIKWYGTCTDIQDQKEQEALLERRVAERTRQLEESNRELENFAYVASHDLQEPLRKIQAFGNLLVDEYNDQLGDGSLYLDRMKAAASRMSMLIEDLLAFSRVTTKQRPVTTVDFSETLQHVLDDLDDRITRTNGSVEVIGTLPLVTIDPTHARQLLQNLISNALKFHKPDAAPLVQIKATEDEDDYTITVTDNGIGFEQKYTEKIFAVFQRLHGKDEYDGTGIGLAICRKIAERYNGTLEAYSTPDKGATFVLKLPKTVNEKESI